MPEPRQDPPLRHLHRHLYLRLVAWLVRARRDDHRAVVRGERSVAPLQVGLVAIDARHPALEAVRRPDPRRAADVREHLLVRMQPVRHALGLDGAAGRHARRAEHRDEQLDLAHLAGHAVDDRRTLAREVDEHALAGLVRLPHRQPPFALPRAVAIAERGVLHPLGVCFEILEVQQLERDAGPERLAADARRIRLRERAAWVRPPLAVEQALEFAVGELFDDRPREACLGGSRRGLVDYAGADTDARGRLSHGALRAPAQSKNLSGLVHEESLRSHRGHSDPVRRWAKRRPNDAHSGGDSIRRTTELEDQRSTRPRRADLGVHDGPISVSTMRRSRCPRWADLGVHDAAISVSTMSRYAQCRLLLRCFPRAPMPVQWRQKP
jgi:hypothetical protein